MSEGILFSRLLEDRICGPFIEECLGESKVKNYHPVSHLSEDGKIFEKLVDNRLVDLLEKCGLISDSQHGFRSPQPIADLLTVVSDRIGRPFNRSGAT